MYPVSYQTVSSSFCLIVLGQNSCSAFSQICVTIISEIYEMFVCLWSTWKMVEKNCLYSSWQTNSVQCDFSFKVALWSVFYQFTWLPVHSINEWWCPSFLRVHIRLAFSCILMYKVLCVCFTSYSLMQVFLFFLIMLSPHLHLLSNKFSLPLSLEVFWFE